MARQRATQKLYLHPWVVRLTHWLNAIALTVMVLSGLRIFWAYQGFNLDTRVNPEHVYETPALVDLSEGLDLHPAAPTDILVPVRFPQSFYERFTLGGWLAGALRWHFSFMWLYVCAGVLYLGYSVVSGNYRTVVFRPRDARDVWSMLTYYLRLRREAPPHVKYNPLQRLAYTLIVLAGVGSVLTGVAIYKPVQVEWLTRLFGGYQYTRLWHFLLVWVFVGFFLLHVTMVLLHGWGNFLSMITGWKPVDQRVLMAGGVLEAPAPLPGSAAVTSGAPPPMDTAPSTEQEGPTHDI